MLENWFNCSLVFLLTILLNSLLKSNSNSIFLLSSIFKIINAPGILIGLVISPIFSLLKASLIFEDKEFSVTHPILPPFIEVSDIL